jgi:hypothetical protein
MATLTIQLDDHLMHHAETDSERTGKSLGTLRKALREAPSVDEDFGRDLDSIRSQQPKLPADPWQS